MGTIEAVDGDHLTISFDHAGTKRVMAQFVAKPDHAHGPAMNAVSGWTIIVEVPKHAAEIFDRALARFRPRPHRLNRQIRIFGASKRLPSAHRMKRRWLALSRSRRSFQIFRNPISVSHLCRRSIGSPKTKNLFNRFPLADSSFIPRITTELCPPEVHRSPSTQVPLSERDRTAPPLAASLRWTDYRETHPRVAF